MCLYPHVEQSAWYHVNGDSDFDTFYQPKSPTNLIHTYRGCSKFLYQSLFQDHWYSSLGFLAASNLGFRANCLTSRDSNYNPVIHGMVEMYIRIYWEVMLLNFKLKFMIFNVLHWNHKIEITGFKPRLA